MNRLGTGIGLATGILALILAATAMARGTSIDCTAGGRCEGTPSGEFLQGGPLEDQIFAFGGNDSMEGEGAVDLLKGGSGIDVLEGGAQGDTMKGGSGDDTNFGPMRARGVVLPGPNRTNPGFFGDEGPDDIFGGSGNDHLEAEEGTDEMFGGAGKDYLDAINDDTDGTKDKLNCGKGFDRYSARAGDVVADNCEKKVPGSLPI